MSRSGPRDLYANYKPGAHLLTALEAWEASVAEEERLRHKLRKAVAVELATGRVKRDGELHPISHGAVAEHLPWTEVTVHGIAKEYGVPGVRQRKKELNED